MRPRSAGVAPITKPETPGPRVVPGDEVTAGAESARSASAYGAGDRARLFEYAVRQTARSLLVRLSVDITDERTRAAAEIAQLRPGSAEWYDSLMVHLAGGHPWIFVA